jgi:hypothetical protein
LKELRGKSPILEGVLTISARYAGCIAKEIDLSCVNELAVETKFLQRIFWGKSPNNHLLVNKKANFVCYNPSGTVAKRFIGK